MQYLFPSFELIPCSMLLLLFSCSVLSHSLWPHELQHVRLPCPSLTPTVCSLMSIESVMLSNHLILCLPLLFRPSIFPSIRGLSSELAVCIRWDQNIGASASACVLQMNIQSWFLLGLTGLVSLQSKRLSRVFSNTTVQKHQFFGVQPYLWFNSYIHTWLSDKP